MPRRVILHISKPLLISLMYITFNLTLLHSEWPKLHRVLAILSAIGLSAFFVVLHTISRSDN